MLGNLSKNKRRPTAAFVITLIGGIIIFIGGIVTALFGVAATYLIGWVHSGFLFGAYASSVIGIITGIIIIISAIMLDTKYKSKITEWSVVALIFTVLSLFNLGGFGVGFILALIGSIIGLSKGE